MKYLSAYALAWLATEKEPSMKDLEKIITSVGGEFDQSMAQVVIDKLKGQNLAEVVRAGLPKLQSVAAAGGGGGGAGTATEKVEETKEEEVKKEEEEDEDAMEGAMDLFGGDDW